MEKLFVVVDYQNDFVCGALGFPGAEKPDALIAEKIRLFRTRGDAVAFTFDTHGAEYLSTREGKALPVPHCLRGGPGWELYGRTAREFRDKDPVFIKNTFGSGDLFDWLRERAFRSVELAGLVLNICVIANAVLARTALPEAEVTVDARAVAAPDPVIAEKTFDLLESLQITVLNRTK